ncbi:TetR/AcrR family transcriptional regulator [Corynebacterium guangdongense]|uniref:AcrR family transcriptional regulator n=1 Tax=Corynebacterium guangdongense TaxID=1783348 RepID=A0ABU1ZXH1_9CORY|nr:TetR/AcrR family transcriptional regulator [Corynebacterium guangdongense]MDR7329631.1 AcrR family transcriptional regulator [Corynebacterium guangdongense]WJZ18196.1 HTH-type transcriptional repressor FabR [Corynebacterium guangdongense]
MNTVNIRKYHHGNLRAELIQAAVDLAAEHGPEGFSLRGVARHVGVSPSAAYRHFVGQDELRSEVAAVAAERLADAMRAAIGGLSDPGARLAASGRAYVDFATAEPGLFRAMLATPDFDPERPGGGGFGVLRTLVAEAGLGEDVATVAVALWATVHGLATLLTSGPLAALPEEERRELIDATLNFVGSRRGPADGVRRG